MNLFSDPQRYLSEFYQKTPFSSEQIEAMRKDFSGLSMMCVWLTKLCPLQCEKCFFKSNMNHAGLREEEYCFTDEGLRNLIAFINQSNSGYLMLSGGGDPMVVPNQVARIIEETQTRRIVIVTSGFWARTKENTKRILSQLYNAYLNRKNREKCEVVLRLSVDRFHEKELGSDDPYVNIVEEFKEKYYNVDGFSLLIHTMRDDVSVFGLAKRLNGTIQFGELGESDNRFVIKIVPQKASLCVDKLSIPIGISKLFLSDLMININPPLAPAVENAIRVMTDDMENSEQGNPSYIQNALGRKGLDFWVDYNGNVTTWFNQDWYALFNIYTDDYDTLVQKTFANPMTAHFLRKGYENRNSIVSEVNPLALLRAQAVNLRDYFAAFLLEEDHTKLYYAIRTVQLFLKDCVISQDALEIYSPELRALICSSQFEIKQMYDSADYDILVQYLHEETFDETQWSVIFLLVALGQYRVSTERLQKKIRFYAEKTGRRVSDIKDFLMDYDENLYFRLHKRISFMKPQTYATLYADHV